MEEKALVEYIIQEVLKRLQTQDFYKKKKILVIVNGGTINLEHIIIELEKIKKEYNLEIIFSEAGEKIVGKEKFKNFEIKNITDMQMSEELIADKEMIILPFLTKNTCSKVAFGIRDNIITYIISKALLNEKTIIAAYDSCRVKVNNEYGKQLNLNINKLKDYGIIFVEGKNLSDYVLKYLKQEIVNLKNKNIITHSEIRDRKNKNIVISKEAIITMLAKEKAKENNIVFEIEK